MEEHIIAFQSHHGAYLPSSSLSTTTPPKGDGPDSKSGKRILLIESDESNAKLISAVLSDEDGYDVKWVSTPIEAFDTLGLAPGAEGYTRWPADLILFDLGLMDRKNKLALRRIIETHRKWPPVIVLSDWPVQYMEDTLAGVGRAGVIARPFDLDNLTNSVHQVLNKHND
jgi:DNA-binding response OmpR family regulator